MQHTISHIYNNYTETDSSISKQTFVDICSEFNMMIIDYILDGKEFNMGHNLSTLSVVRMESSFIIKILMKVSSGTYTIRTVSILNTIGVKVSAK